MKARAKKQPGPPAVIFATDPVPAPPGMRRVTVHTIGDGFRSVNAWLYGEWAAHMAVCQPGWTVTYLPCGRRLHPKPLTEDQARRCADWFACHITRDELINWAEPSAEVVARIYQGIEAAATNIDVAAIVSASEPDEERWS